MSWLARQATSGLSRPIRVLRLSQLTKQLRFSQLIRLPHSSGIIRLSRLNRVVRLPRLSRFARPPHPCQFVGCHAPAGWSNALAGPSRLLPLPGARRCQAPQHYALLPPSVCTPSFPRHTHQRLLDSPGLNHPCHYLLYICLFPSFVPGFRVMFVCL